MSESTAAQNGTTDTDLAPASGGGLDGAAAKLLAKHGPDARMFARMLVKERAIDRATIATLEKKLRNAVPAGARVISGDELALLDVLKASKITTPDALTGALTERETLRTKDAERARLDKVDEVADLAKAKRTVLRRLSRDPEHGFEIVEIKDVDEGGGTAARVPYVRRAGDGQAQPVKLTDYVRQHFADDEVALWHESAGTPSPSATTSGSAPARTPEIKPFPWQTGTGTASPSAKTPEQLREAKRASGAYAL